MHLRAGDVTMKSGKPYQHTVRFDEKSEDALNDVKKYYEEQFLVVDEGPIFRAAMVFYQKFLRGQLVDNVIIKSEK
jgi:hypothetical protein